MLLGALLILVAKLLWVLRTLLVWVALGFSVENLAVEKLVGECCYLTPVPGASSS
jgi:hypothetical protein